MTPADFDMGPNIAAMPYLDTHRHIPGLTAEALADAHRRTSRSEPNYDVRYVRYWFDEATGRVYCLVEAPTPELADAGAR